MELGRLIDILKPKAVLSGDFRSEVAEQEVKRWEEAYLGRSLFQDVYVALLALRNDPSKKVYATLVVDPWSVRIDIPLADHTPEETLIQQAYETTIFGEIDPEKYRPFATGEFTRGYLLALLNRKTAGVSPDDTPEWFYTTFGVKHLEPYGDLYIGSHGGQGTYGYTHNATIEWRKSRTQVIIGMSTLAALDFAKVTQRSLPHMSVTPLPVDVYLEDVQSTLKFLPRDWEPAGKTS